MPIFTEGQDPLDHQDPLNFFRSGPSSAEVAQHQHEWMVQQQRDANTATMAYIFLGLIVLAAAYGVFLHRRKLARAADAALVSGLATGVRAARKAASAKDAFTARVLAKADEIHPSAD